MTEQELPYFGAPPPRVPLPVAHLPAVRGKRVVLSTPEGFVYDVRAASEVVADPAGDYLWVVTEVGWYRWMLCGDEPTFQRYPVALVHAE